MHIRNGMPAADLGTQGWAKPWSGPNGGDCLEAKKLPGGRVALRQSTDPARPRPDPGTQRDPRLRRRRQGRAGRRPPHLIQHTPPPRQRATATGTFPDTRVRECPPDRPAKRAGMRER